VHFIPQPKHVTKQDKTCDALLGFSIRTIPPSLQGYCQALLPYVTEQGLSIQLDTKYVEVPKDLFHWQRLQNQAYRLEITTDAVLISAESEAGFRDAIATLRQLWLQKSSSLPCVIIEDYPTVPIRGMMLDVSRGKIPNRKKIEEIVLLLASYKYTLLQLYMEDCYILESHPSLGVLNGYYDKQEVLAIDALCKSFGIELQPNIQSLSHVHGLVRNPGYQELAEGPALFSFGAGNPDVYRLIDDILGEVMPWFTSKTINLDLDEAYDLGTCYSKKAVGAKGPHEVFLEHINAVAALARKHGALKIFIWGDCLNTYPGLQDEVDEDVFFIDWNYNPLEHFPSLNNHEGKKKPFWVAPGTSSWNALFPRVQNANTNLKNYIFEGCKRQTEGVLVTHWGDYGHHQPISFSYHGFVVGAEHAYNGGVTTQEALQEAMAKLFFVDKKQKEGFDLLAKINLLPSITNTFKSQSFYALFDDLFKGLTIEGDDRYPPITQKTFQQVQELASRALQSFSESGASLTFHQELVQAAASLEFVGRKGMLSYEIRETFASGDVDESIILGWILAIKLLYRDFLALRHRFTELWEKEAVSIGREGALYFFAHASSRFAEVVIWLNNQRLALEEGESIDTKMDTYKAHEGYTTLWTGNCTNLWDRAYPWR